MRLGDIAKERKETYKGDKGGIRLVGLEHLISGELRFADYDIDTENTFSKVFHKGDILFGRRRAYLKKAAIAEFDGICSGDITVLQAISNKVNPELLPFIIQNNALFDFAVSRSAGGLSPRVKWEHLADYEFELPSIAQQRVLAEKLWAAYNLKEAYKKMNSAIDEMVKSQFIEMFGNPNRNTKGFNQYAISDIFDLQMGKTPERGNQNYWNKGVNIWISISDMQDDCKYVGDSKEYITDMAVSESGIKIIPQGTLLMSFKLTIGRVAIADKDIYTNEAIMAFKDKCVVELSQQWLYNLLTQYDWLGNASQAAKGKTLNKEIIGRSIVCIPPIEIQEEFATIVQQADKSKFELKQAIDKIEKVMKSLLQ